MSIRFQNIPIFQNLNLFEERWCFMANRLIILILCKCQNGYTELKWSALEDFRRLITGFSVFENSEIRECRYVGYLRHSMSMKACDSNSPSSKLNCLIFKLAFCNHSFWKLAQPTLTIQSERLGAGQKVGILKACPTPCSLGKSWTNGLLMLQAVIISEWGSRQGKDRNRPQF